MKKNTVPYHISIVKKSLSQNFKDILYFLLKVLKFCTFTFKCLLHLGFIFVYMIWGSIFFFFILNDYRSTIYHTIHSFPHWSATLALLHKPSLCTWVFGAFSSIPQVSLSPGQFCTKDLSSALTCGRTNAFLSSDLVSWAIFGSSKSFVLKYTFQNPFSNFQGKTCCDFN